MKARDGDLERGIDQVMLARYMREVEDYTMPVDFRKTIGKEL